MLKRPIGRLAAAVTVAGTVAALAATAAVAAPGATWSLPTRPIPGAVTNDSPSVGDISFNSALGQGTIVAWRGTGVFGHVFYKYRTPTLGHWTKTAFIPGAYTNSAPAIVQYGGTHDPFHFDAVVAVWTGRFGHIRYSEGETHPNGTISWTRPTIISVRYADSIEAPAAFFPYNSYVMVVAWRGPANHVRYTIGTPSGRGFTWSKSAVVPGGTLGSPHCLNAPCTSATPAIAEVETMSQTGTMYIFWKQLGTTKIFYSAATDSPSTNWNHVTWSATPQQVPDAATSVAPAASAIPPLINGPILLVYKVPARTAVKFQTLTGASWSVPPARVRGAETTVAPALRGATLATTTPVTLGRIVLQFFH
jgi:hypothetical protein